MYGVSQITVTEDVALITLNKVPADLRMIAELFEAFSQAEINIDMISQTAPYGNSVNCSFSIRSADLIQVLDITRKFKEHYPQVTPMISNGNCKIQLYGEEMRQMHGVAAKAIATVIQTNTQLSMLTTSEVDISMLVSSGDMPDTVAALEEAFALSAND